MDGCKDLAMWIELQEGGRSDKFKDTEKRAIPVTRNPGRAQFQPGLIQSLAGFSLNLMISRAEYGLSNKLLLLATGLTIAFG